MSDTVVEQPVTSVQVATGENAQNPFDEWREEPVVPPAQQQQATPPVPLPAATPPASPTPSGESDDETFDEADYLRQNFGWESQDAGKTELQRLRDLEKNPKPAEFKFDNDDSRKIFDLLKTGKFGEVRQYLDRQDRLDRLSSYDLTKAEQAADVLRAHMAFKNPDLTPQEIDRYISKKFSLPNKPANNLDLTPEENQAAIQAWEQQVRDIETDMIIEAKMVRPELAQFKSQLVLPDITPPVDPAIAQNQQKELQDWQVQRNNYLTALNADLKTFNGFSTKYKDKDVEYEVAFTPTEEEKTALGTLLQDFNRDQFFDARWFDKDGKPKIHEIASDIYWLMNKEKIQQKYVTDSASKRMAALKKERANISVEGNKPQGTWNPANMSDQEKQEAAIWEA